MSNLKIYYLFLFATCWSCTGSDLASSISLKTSVNSNNSSISVGDEFELEVEVIDQDGLNSISIDISALGVVEEFVGIEETKFKLKKTYTVGDSALRGESDIIIYILDQIGEENTKSTTIKID